jgi:hypothetical protein
MTKWCDRFRNFIWKKTVTTVFITTIRKSVSGFIHLLTPLIKRIWVVFDNLLLVDTLITRHRARRSFGTQYKFLLSHYALNFWRFIGGNSEDQLLCSLLNGSVHVAPNESTESVRRNTFQIYHSPPGSKKIDWREKLYIICSLKQLFLRNLTFRWEEIAFLSIFLIKLSTNFHSSPVN